MNAKKILQTLELAETELKSCYQKLGITDSNVLKDVVEAQEQVKNCSIPDVVKSLPNDEQIADAANHWVFDLNGNKWSNNDDTAGDNYGSFQAGVKWLKERLAK